MGKLKNILIGLEEAENCDICGSEDEELQIHFEKDNSVKYICRTCHIRLSNKEFKEIEYLHFLYELLKSSDEFRQITQEGKLSIGHSQFRPDILLEEKDGDNWKKAIIEIKSYNTFTSDRLESVIQQLQAYAEAAEGNAQLIFSFPGVLTEQASEEFKSANIEVWDQPYIARRFSKQIENLKHPIFSKLFKLPYDYSEEEHLIQQIKDTTPGKEEWSRYQKLIGKSLDTLFGATLSSPILESSDGFKVNRRDFILANYAETGFWYYMRTRYSADFIVINAKNYSSKIKKKEILQIAHYLKQQGVGLFGLIISRNGEENNARLTARELWITEKKLIIVLDDEDLFKMLKSQEPHEIIKQHIEDFRLSI